MALWNEDRHSVMDLISAGQMLVARSEDDRDDAEGNEGRDLDDVHCDRGVRRATHTAIRDVPGNEREHNGKAGKCPPTKNLSVRDGGVDVAGECCGESDHDARIDPVVQMADPSDRQLGRTRVLPMLRLLLIEKSSLGEVVARAGTRIGVDASKLAVRVGSEEGQDQRERQTGPHVGRGRLRPRDLCRLELERRPQERARRDQRHRVHGDARQGETSFHLARGCFFGHLYPLLDCEESKTGLFHRCIRSVNHSSTACYARVTCLLGPDMGPFSLRNPHAVRKRCVPGSCAGDPRRESDR